VLAPRLRRADQRELEAAPGFRSCLKSLKGCLTVTPNALAVDIHGVGAVGVFGVVPLVSSPIKEGIIWFLGSELLFHNPYRKLFIQNSRPVLHHLAQGYSLLSNQVESRNTVHIRWLRWLGFTFVRHVPGSGRSGESFYEFLQTFPPCVNPSPLPPSPSPPPPL
jgi:hypothetical protein